MGRRPQTEQDHAHRGQDRQVQVLPESHRDRVHQKEDGGGVQHSSAAHCGAAGAPWNSSSQHPSSAHRQDMVRGQRILCGLLLSFQTANDYLNFTRSSESLKGCLHYQSFIIVFQGDWLTASAVVVFANG